MAHGGFLRRVTSQSKFFPERFVDWRLSCRIFFLQRLQLAFQLPQRKRQLQLRRDKKRLHEKHSRDENDDRAQQQGETQPRPAFASRVGEYKGFNNVPGTCFHEEGLISTKRWNIKASPCARCISKLPCALKERCSRERRRVFGDCREIRRS